jgi:hypothetical protein
MTLSFDNIFQGLTCAYTPTSAYVTFAKVPAIGSDLLFDAILSASTIAEKIDLRFVRSIASESSQFLLVSTTFENQTSGFQGNTTKHALAFALQARQSCTLSTDFARTIQVRFMTVE